MGIHNIVGESERPLHEQVPLHEIDQQQPDYRLPLRIDRQGSFPAITDFGRPVDTVYRGSMVIDNSVDLFPDARDSYVVSW